MYRDRVSSTKKARSQSSRKLTIIRRLPSLYLCTTLRYTTQPLGGRVIKQSGEITATSVNEPVTSIARERGLNPLVDLVSDQIPWLFTGIVVKQGSLAARRDVLVRFIKAVAEGNQLALADQRRAKEVLARQVNINNQTILDISYNDFKKQSP